MKAYVEFEVCNGAYEVSCPDDRCSAGAALSLDEIAALVSPSVMEKHLKFRLNQGMWFIFFIGLKKITSLFSLSLL